MSTITKKTKPNASVLLGSRVRALRMALNWSQEDFAFHAGLDRAYVSRIERGIGNPTIHVLTKISDTLGVGMRELFCNEN